LSSDTAKVKYAHPLKIEVNSQRTEHEIKVEGTYDLPALLRLGGELLGQGIQKDIYLAGRDHLRIREESGQCTLTHKHEDVGDTTRVKGVSSRFLSEAEVRRLIREHGIRVQVCKKRTWVRLGTAVIRLDEVEHLGQFVEISAADEASLSQVLGQLGLSGCRLIRQSYRDLMIARALPRWVQLVLRFHEKVGELAFGITSGILTTIGVLVGVNSATADRLAVVAAVVAIAVADSCSDAFGMYMARVSERGVAPKQALRHALGTLLGKAFLPLTFLGPLLVLPLDVAVWVDLAWGALALALLSAEQAVVEQRPVARRIARNLGLAVVIVANSILAGLLVARLKG
jgi:predicted adenylyl cyclase CyaB